MCARLEYTPENCMLFIPQTSTRTGGSCSRCTPAARSYKRAARLRAVVPWALLRRPKRRRSSVRWARASLTRCRSARASFGARPRARATRQAPPHCARARISRTSWLLLQRPQMNVNVDTHTNTVYEWYFLNALIQIYATTKWSTVHTAHLPFRSALAHIWAAKLVLIGLKQPVRLPVVPQALARALHVELVRATVPMGHPVARARRTARAVAAVIVRIRERRCGWQHRTRRRRRVGDYESRSSCFCRRG